MLVPVSNINKACDIYSCKIILNGNGRTGISYPRASNTTAAVTAAFSHSTSHTVSQTHNKLSMLHILQHQIHQFLWDYYIFL